MSNRSENFEIKHRFISYLGLSLPGYKFWERSIQILIVDIINRSWLHVLLPHSCTSYYFSNLTTLKIIFVSMWNEQCSSFKHNICVMRSSLFVKWVCKNISVLVTWFAFDCLVSIDVAWIRNLLCHLNWYASLPKANGAFEIKFIIPHIFIMIKLNTAWRWKPLNINFLIS